MASTTIEVANVAEKSTFLSSRKYYSRRLSICCSIGLHHSVLAQMLRLTEFTDRRVHRTAWTRHSYSARRKHHQPWQRQYNTGWLPQPLQRARRIIALCRVVRRPHRPNLFVTARRPNHAELALSDRPSVSHKLGPTSIDDRRLNETKSRGDRLA